MKSALYIFIFLFTIASSVFPAEAPSDMKEFNVKCPAHELCPLIEQAYVDCKRTKKNAVCLAFVQLFEKLIPIYDCQRPVDHTPSKDYIVPAIYLCEPTKIWNCMELLSNLELFEAEVCFASSEFRSILNGEYGEGFRSLSEQKAKKLRTKSAN